MVRPIGASGGNPFHHLKSAQIQGLLPGSEGDRQAPGVFLSPVGAFPCFLDFMPERDELAVRTAGDCELLLFRRPEKPRSPPPDRHVTAHHRIRSCQAEFPLKVDLCVVVVVEYGDRAVIVGVVALFSKEA